MEWNGKWNGTEISVWNMEDDRMEWKISKMEWKAIKASKQKSSKAILRVHYFMLKMLQKAMYLDFPVLGQVTKFNPKMKDFKRVLDLT